MYAFVTAGPAILVVDGFGLYERKVTERKLWRLGLVYSVIVDGQG